MPPVKIASSSGWAWRKTTAPLSAVMLPTPAGEQAFLTANGRSCCHAMHDTSGRGAGPSAASTTSARPLSDVTFCVLDLETTGGNRNDDAITEVGAVKVRGGECLGTFQTLVNPGRAIPPQITVLTGFTEPSSRPRRGSRPCCRRCSSSLGDAVVVGHNVGFDLGFLHAALRADGYGRASAPVGSTPLRSPAGWCATRCPTAGSAPWPRGCASTTARATAPSTTPSPPPTCSTCSSSGPPGSASSASTTSSRSARWPAIRRPSSSSLTSSLPRAPGVYLFRGDRDEVLYVGKATNLRQRVRSYFGREDRRRIGPMLREVQSIRHHCLPDPLSAEVVEARLIARLLPRYNRAGTRADRYCYVRLDIDSAWPRLAVVRDPGRAGCTSGRCRHGRWPTWWSTRCRRCCRCAAARCASVGATSRPPDATPCGPAQTGRRRLPVRRSADRRTTTTPCGRAVAAVEGSPRRRRALDRPDAALAAAQRYEEAAMARDRLSALEGRSSGPD